MGNNGRITLKDVASEAEVALMTASKVFNGDQSVRPYLRRRVIAVGKKLGYRPNNHARALRNSQSDIISLAMVGLDNPFFGLLAERLCTGLRVEGMQPLLCNDIDSVEEINRTLMSAGTILVTPGSYQGLNSLLAENENVICIFGKNGSLPSGVPNVLLDFEYAYREIINHCLKEGRKRFCYCCRDTDFSFISQNSKVKNIRNILSEEGIDLHLPLQKELLDLKLFAKFITEELECDAIFCENDLLAFKLLYELRQLGNGKKDDLRLIGCDGIELQGSSIWTIKIDIDQIVQQTVKCLKKMIAGKEFPIIESIRPKALIS